MKKHKSIVYQKFCNFIKNKKLFTKHKSVLAAISGGQDSICLLKLLKDFQIYQDLTVHIIHFDHGWRNDSKKNAIFIKNIANRWNFICHYETADKMLSEEDARMWRYTTMRKICQELKIKYIITGHTYSDKLETVFFNMMNGTGFEGLQSIQPEIQVSTHINIIHPLINVKRDETLDFCRNFCLPIWSDTTNYNRKIKRNRIREELIPYCKQYFNSNLEDSLSKFMQNANYDLDYLQERTYYLYYKYKHPKYVGINRTSFSLLSLSMKRRIIRIFIYHNTDIKLSFLETQEYIELIKYKNNQKKKISVLWYLYIDHEWIYLLSNKKI